MGNETVLDDYRNHLILAEQSAQADYDKTVLSLSGGALGVSFAFVKDIVGPAPFLHSWALFLSWIFWGLSVSSVLSSYFFSQMALRYAIKQVDEDKIYDYIPGGPYSKITAGLNASGGIFFFLGVFSITVFVLLNVCKRCSNV